MIHYHGLPLTPKSELLEMAGKCFCVSFAYPSDADWAMVHGQSVMWDNGAFTTWKQKKTFDISAFAEWVAPRLGHPHWAVVPDVIDGTVDEQRELIAQWPHRKALSAPVWHLGLSIDWLLELADGGWGRICFGSSGRYAVVGSSAWARRTDEAFNALAKRGPLPWVHMMRGLALCGDRWPFASADSTNVAINFKGDSRRGNGATCPERMARRIDAVQCPIKWTPRHKTLDLFAEPAP